MARTEAGKPRPKSKRGSKSKFTDKEQSERFIEAARSLDIEKTGKPFDDAARKILRSKRSSD